MKMRTAKTPSKHSTLPKRKKPIQWLQTVSGLRSLVRLVIRGEISFLYVVCPCYGSLDFFHRYYWSCSNLRAYDFISQEIKSRRSKSLKPSTPRTFS